MGKVLAPRSGSGCNQPCPTGGVCLSFLSEHGMGSMKLKGSGSVSPTQTLMRGYGYVIPLMARIKKATGLFNFELPSTFTFEGKVRVRGIIILGAWSL